MTPDTGDALISLDELTWVQNAQCIKEGGDWSDYFVQAGHSISDKAMDVCKRCPVRKDCLTWAYDRNLGAGYFGGVSHGTRKKLTLEEALLYIETK